ncbi:MAG: glycoside hydrolase family 13 protein [Lachnospiraceae bacterium]|nr:glycoside hydrolase family 13 protein [Lachnospiraceae bacterium]
MRPVLKKKALFSDMSEDYLTPSEPRAYDEVTIRFRSAVNNVDRVYFVSKYEKLLMMKTSSDDEFDYYEIRVQLENETVRYHFEIRTGKIICYFDASGVTRELREEYEFKLIPGFKTPDWAKGAVMYQIYVDRFCNGDSSNDVLTNEYYYIGDYSQRVEDWNKYPAAMGVREFYGGDLQGVLDKLDYLQELGVEVIYFNPLFVSPSNHKYDIQDYDHIDPHIGKIVVDEGELLQPGMTENRQASRYITRVSDKRNLEASDAMFARLVSEAHKRGIRVILDGVFNHCGSFNKWMDRERIYEEAEGYEKGAFVSENSPYRSYFAFFQNHWPYNTSYDGWWGHDTLPKLNYEDSKQLYDYVMYIARKWVSPPFNVDGWRLDVAADLGHSPEFNHKFWKDFRRNVKMANPNAIIIAEHYGDPRSWLEGDEWDTVMNYDAFMEPITWFLTGMQKHSDDYREELYGNADAFWGAMRHFGSGFARPSMEVAMNELSNHDHSRFLTRTNKIVGRVSTYGPETANQGVNKAVFREAVLMQMTWVGAPTIYYGDEAGVCGFTDPDNRRTYPWGKEDHELIDFHKQMIRIRKENPEIRNGSLKELISEYQLIGYGRFTREEQAVILVHNGDHEITKEVSVWELGIPRNAVLEQLMMTTAGGYTTEQKEYLVLSGKVTVTLPATSAVVLKHRKKSDKTPCNSAKTVI